MLSYNYQENCGSIPKNACVARKHSYVWLPRKHDYRTDGQTDRQTDKVIPMCQYASQATQKVWQPGESQSDSDPQDFDIKYTGQHVTINVPRKFHGGVR